MKKRLITASLAAMVVFAPVHVATAADASSVITSYSDMAAAKYGDALTTARALKTAVDAFVAAPSAESLAAARTAWLAARVPYQQTEVYRFGNAIVDDWEGKVNAWPLDEGLIDYVDPAGYGDASDENPFYTVNVVANKTVTAGGKTVDATTITPAVLESLQEVGGVEANVATGYHAIEFLLWGQDNNGTGPGAGNRPHTDFDTANCTGGNCDRRATYLKAATDLLIKDLEDMAANWSADGAARKNLAEGGAKEGLKAILTGMGSLSYGELAGERMKLGLLLHDPEEEHDCFSDNTHNSHLYDVIGIQNVYLGKYKRPDGSILEGAALSDLVREKDAALDTELRENIADTVSKMQVMAKRAEAGESYDQMIAEGNAQGNAVVQAAIDALVAQTRTIEKVVAALDLKIEVEGSDSLDNPSAVNQ
ncbi:MAG: imelysin family protein [Pseudomonadota bacterium]